MHADQFPMFRFATLLARQLSSPISTRIKDYATTHPRIQRSVVARVGRLYQAAELRFRLWSLRLPAPDRLPTVSDADALQAGSNLLGEIIVFSLGAGIIIFEVNRQAEKQETKVLDERSQWVAILVGLEELQRELVFQQQDLERLQGKLKDILNPPSPPPSAPGEASIPISSNHPSSSETGQAIDKHPQDHTPKSSQPSPDPKNKNKDRVC